jgi:hypothetical protein
MSACCDEFECKRREPIAIYKGDFGGTVYAVLASRQMNERTRVATQRHVITAAVEKFILANREYVLEVLNSERPA